ncbi:MAG: Mu-like prophage major head subunit gpT family protein [Pseudomonadota bacterium]
MEITSPNLERLFRGFKTSFQQKFNETEPMWNKVAFRVPSMTAAEDYGWLGEFPSMKEWIGSRVLKSIATHSYSITNKDWESTVTVRRNKIKDDQYGIYGPMMGEMGQSAKAHPDELVFGLLPAGFTTICYDGQNFFDDDHPVYDPKAQKEVSVSNMQDGGGAPWFLMDTSRTILPVIFQEREKPVFTSLTDPKNSDHVFMNNEYVFGVDARYNVGFSFWQLAAGSKAPLTRENFRALRTGMTSLKNDEGRPLNVKPTIIVVGPSNADAARDLFLSERLPNGETNTDRNLVEIVEVPWLD